MWHGFDFVPLLVCLFFFLRAGHPAIAWSGKGARGATLRSLHDASVLVELKICWGPRLTPAET